MTSKPATALPQSLPQALPTPGAPRSLNSPPRPLSGWSPRTRFLLTVAVVLLLLSGLGAAVLLPGWKNDRKDLVTHTVKRELLELTVVERGTLESANNRDIICRVKAGNRSVASSIKWVIDDGTIVRAGQEVVRLESSALEDLFKAQNILMEQRENEWSAAQEHLKIVLSQNESNLATAKINIQLAVLDLEKFIQGDYEQQKKDILSRKDLAKSDVEMWADRVAWSERMVKKAFLSPLQAQAERARLRSSQTALEKIDEEFRVLEKFTLNRTKTELTGKVEETKRALARVETEARSLEGQARKDADTKYSVFLKEKDKYEELKEEIRKCTLTAPADGMVVYYIPQQSRSGSGSRQTTIAQGEPVTEGQKLMQIPDLSRMLVNTRVHEALVSRVRGEEFKKTGFYEAMQANLLVTPSLTTRLATLSYMTEGWESDDFRHLRDKDAIRIYEGQRVVVRVGSFASRPLEGRVKSVATVAQTQEYSSDVKFYQTMVEIQDSFPGLKPGMSAEVTIHTDTRVEDALTVPVQAVVRVPGKPPRYKCFIKTPTGFEEKAVKVGISNDKMIEIVSGLAEGDEVILNTKAVDSGSDSGVDNSHESGDASSSPAKDRKGAGGGKDRSGGKSGKGGGNQKSSL